MEQIIVITPAGQIIVPDLARAMVYKRMYGYPYVVREKIRPTKAGRVV